jgi:hypothetical protein
MPDTLADLAQEHSGHVVGIPVAPKIQVFYVNRLPFKPNRIIVLDTETGEGVKLTFGSRSSLVCGTAFPVEALTWLSERLQS